jgi:hypothetical protein
MTDDQQDFVPVEPTPAAAQPAAPAQPTTPPPAADPAAPNPAPPTAPPGYYAPTAPTAPAAPAYGTPGYGVPAAPPAYGAPVAPGYPAGYPGQYGYVPPAPQGLSIASMILGIAGTFFSFGYGLGLFPAIAGVITGHMARKRQPHARGFWLAGLITGYIGIGISLIWIAVGVTFLVIGLNGGFRDYN